MEDTYRFRVRGRLDDRWSICLEGLAITRQDDGTTELVGQLADQAALHGVIARIRDLGLPLLAVEREQITPHLACDDRQTDCESTGVRR